MTRTYRWLLTATAALTAVAGMAFAVPGLATAAEEHPVSSVTASAHDGNVPQNTIDGDLATRWSAEGDGQWIRFDLGAAKPVGSVAIAWHKGDQRRASFDVQVSGDATTWQTVHSGQSSGVSLQLEHYDVTDATSRYVRIVGHGNTDSAWNSITEVEIYGGEPPPPPGRTVSSLRELVDAVAAAAPGDRIVLRNGTYNTSSRVYLRGRGSSSARVLVEPESPGGVVIDGSHGFTVDDSSYLTLRGFVFRHGTADGRGMEISDSSHVQISRNHFELDNSGATKWLRIRGGTGMRIDHNRFQNKTTGDSLLLVDPGGDDRMATHTVIEHNHFRNLSSPSHDTNEAIRVGWSGGQLQATYTIVQYNLFENCDGDPEVISNKTSHNTYRYNTFRSNWGSLVLRHGDQARVEGNYFLGNQGGLRMYGDNHTVVNNYFEGNTGSGSESTFLVGSGDYAADGSDWDQAKYDQPNGGTLAFNTLYNNRTHLTIGNDHPLAPRNIRVGNNIVRGSSGELIHYGDTPSGFTWEGQILWGSDRGDSPHGYRVVDPRLAEGTDSVYRQIWESPGRDASASSDFYTTVGTDLDGHTRSGTKDVGADEYSTSAPVRRPLQAGDVGP